MKVYEEINNIMNILECRDGALHIMDERAQMMNENDCVFLIDFVVD